MPKPWRLLDTTPEGDFKVFRLRRDRACNPRTGQAHDFFVLEAPDWVNVIPLTADAQVVLVRQYRHGTRTTTLELPGGLVDPGETPAAAARRELLEETGHGCEQVRSIGVVDAQPALQDNRCHTFLAEDCRALAAPRPDAGEDLAVVRVPLVDIPHLVRAGEITHGLVLAAFYWLHLEQASARARRESG